MKRIKLVLTAIVALSAMGGALAIKTKTIGGTKYCYTTTTATAATCRFTVGSAEFFQTGPDFFKYVTISASENCSPARACTQVAKAIGV